MRFCPDCGAPTRRALPEGDTLERDVCTDCGGIHYQNPKVVVGAVCTWENKVLLCRRAIEPRAGYWTIPAGFMEMGESTEQGAVRETMEEATARIEIVDLLAIYNIARLSQVQIFYRANMLTPDFSAGVETLELDLFDWRKIPWDDLAFPTVHWILEKAIEVRGQPAPVAPEVRG
ncbi:MAG: NUDIX hydrolase [Geminicoccaceae bacterium]